jgi:hypothetical protein
MALPNLSGVAIDDEGGVLTASPSDHVIYRLDREGNLKIFAGTGWSSGSTEDGAAALDSRLNQPRRVKRGPDGSIYFFDFDRIRRIHASTGTIDTVVSQSQFPMGDFLWSQYAVFPDGDLLLVINRTRMVRWHDGNVSPIGKWPDDAGMLELQLIRQATSSR